MSKLFPSVLPGDDRGYTPATAGDDEDDEDDSETEGESDE
jgi:hypothetical protein